MGIICTPQMLNIITQENPGMTVVEYIASQEEEMTLEDIEYFEQLERDYRDLVYEMTHQ